MCITRISRYACLVMGSVYPELDGAREPATGGGGSEAIQNYLGTDLEYKYEPKPVVDHRSAA